MRITLRPVREANLEELYAAHVDIANRGASFRSASSPSPKGEPKLHTFPKTRQSAQIVKKIRAWPWPKRPEREPPGGREARPALLELMGRPSLTARDVALVTHDPAALPT
jgi:hypothetical protein